MQAYPKESPQDLLMLLPGQIGNFSAQAPIIYEEKGYGASRGYDDFSSGIALTVYLYDLGFEDIPDGIDSEIILCAKKEATQQVDEAAKMGLHKDAKLIRDIALDFDFAKGKTLKVWFVSYAYDTPISFRPIQYMSAISDMYLAGLRRHIFKIRVTRAQTQEGKAEEIKEVVKTLFSTLII